MLGSSATVGLIVRRYAALAPQVMPVVVTPVIAMGSHESSMVRSSFLS